MSKKHDKDAVRTAEAEMTALHEVFILLSRLERGPVCYIDDAEWSRLVTALEGQEPMRQAFLGLGFLEEPKRECYINLSHVVKINILDCLAGFPQKKRPKLTDAELDKQIEEREASEDTIILRVWMTTGKAVDLYHDIDYQDWVSIRRALEENDQQFIGFTDEDGERVILSVAHIGAIEAFDTHYLSDQDMDHFFGTNGDTTC
jgi:hypothetical protein